MRPAPGPARPAALPAALLAAFLVLPAPALAAPPADPAAARQRLEGLDRSIRELHRRLDRDRRRKERLGEELRQAEEALQVGARALAATEAALAEARERLGALRARRGEAEARLEALRRDLAALVRAGYRLHRQGLLPALLAAPDPGAAARALRYHAYLGEAGARRARTLVEELRRLETLRAREADQVQHLEGLRRRQAEAQRGLEEARRRRARLLASLDRRLREGSRRLEGLRADRHRLEKLLEELRRRPAAPPSGPGARFASLKGRLPLPAEGPVVSRYGSPRRGGRLRWRGLVIAAPEGSPVRAVAPGRVVFADWLRGYGLLLIVDHGDGYMSLYGFNERLDKGVGDPVHAGEQVAAAAGPQGSLRPGLYFEIRHQGRPLDPLAWCRAGHRAREGAGGGAGG